MNLYTFSYWRGKERGFFQVIADNQARAIELLMDDGHSPKNLDCESVFTIPDGHTESVFFSMIFED